VVTLQCGVGLAFYLLDEHRWVVSYPQQHHAKGQRIGQRLARLVR